MCIIMCPSSSNSGFILYLEANISRLKITLLPYVLSPPLSAASLILLLLSYPGIIHQSNGGIMGAPSLQVEVTAVPSITTET